MKIKLFSTIIVYSMIVLLPIMAVAAAVPWTSESYRSYSLVSVQDGGSDSDEMLSSSPPVSASAFWSESIGGGSVYTEMTSTSITYSGDLYADMFEETKGTNTAEFLGTYTATSPYFLFSYDNVPSSYNFLNLTVKDMITSSYLYNGDIRGTGDLMISTIAGNNIEVAFNFSMTHVAGPTRLNNITWGDTMTYGMTTIVPEPISSILFVTGGTLLAGRRLLRRKA